MTAKSEVIDGKNGYRVVCESQQGVWKWISGPYKHFLIAKFVSVLWNIRKRRLIDDNRDFLLKAPLSKLELFMYDFIIYQLEKTAKVHLVPIDNG